MRIVDAHVHVNRFDLMAPGPKAVIEQNPTYPLMASFLHDPDAFVAHLDAERIDRAWLINYSAKDVMGYGWEVNPWVADYCAAHPGRLVAIGGYDPRLDGDGAKAVDRLAALGVRGLKLHPVHMRLSPDAHRDGTQTGARLGAAYARAEELSLPVLFHTGTSIFPGADNSKRLVAPIGAVCADFPDLPVVLCHAGRPDQTQEAQEIIRAHDNAWLELSSMPPSRIPEWVGDLDATIKRPQGEVPLYTCCTWGSDWPGPKVPGMRANVDAFLALGHSPSANKAVLAGNADRLIP